MSGTIQYPSDQARPGQSELPTQSLPPEAQPLIVVGYSPRPEGRAALRRALSEARLRGAALVVVNTSSEVDTDRAWPQSLRRRASPMTSGPQPTCTIRRRS